VPGPHHGLSELAVDEPDETLRIHGTPGARYSYSGEGLVYLQVVLERLLNTSLEELMQRYVFKPLGMQQSSYTWQPRFRRGIIAWDTIPKASRTKKTKTMRPALPVHWKQRWKITRSLQLPYCSTLVETCVYKKYVLSANTHPFRAQFGPLRLKDSTLNDAIALRYGLGGCCCSRRMVWERSRKVTAMASSIIPSCSAGRHRHCIFTNSDNGESIY
jgi:hypothetical protein